MLSFLQNLWNAIFHRNTRMSGISLHFTVKH